MSNTFNESELLILQRAEHYCALCEQCITSVRAKMISWGVERQLIERILDYLCQNDFINESRFAKAFCESKIRGQRWGRIKVAFHLRNKHIPIDIIDQSLSEIPLDEYQEILREVVFSRWKNYRSDDLETSKKKLTIFLQSRGFETEIIQQTFNDINFNEL